MADLLEGLNEEQRAAVVHGEGPLMIVAGAGTGKTTVITRRIAWLMETGKAKQDEILALTFTDKAAGEMEGRVDELLPMGYLDLWISTFHGFCERVLRAHALDVGLPNSFDLVNDVQAWMLVRRNLSLFKLDYYKPRGNPTKFIEAMLGHFSRCKDEGVTPEMYEAHVAKIEAEAAQADPLLLGAEGSAETELDRKKWRELADAYTAYQQLLLENNAMDFGDMLLHTVELLKARPNILKQYHKQFRYIVVDEFQDTNTVQYELVKLLTGEEGNITVVGDDDQAIYRFRGAALANILRFRQDHPDSARIVLTQNYRSGSEILDAAYKLIQHNNPHRLEASEQLDKRLKAANGTSGLVRHIHAPTLEDEVRQTVEKIVQLHEAGCAWGDMAILVRANGNADPFILDLERARVPYRFLALSGLYSKPLIIDALAYMRAIDQPNDSPAIYRIICHEALGLPEGDVAEIAHQAKKGGLTYLEALRNAHMFALSDGGKERAQEIVSVIEELRGVALRLPATELFVEVVRKTGLLADITRLPERAQQEHFSLLQTFLERLRAFAQKSPDRSLHAFLEEFEHERAAGESGALPQDEDEGPDTVSIMTVHGAKGLEYRFVFVVNLVEQRFPSQPRGGGILFPPGLVKEDGWTSEDHHREERRLFYVAVTRAKEGLFLLSADDYGGLRRKKPSRFLGELGYEPELGEGATNKKKQLDAPSAGVKQGKAIFKLPDRLSFTQITAFAKCPQQYKYAHVLHVPVFGRHSMSFGKSMHNTLQTFMEQLIPSAQPQGELFSPPVPSLTSLYTLMEENWIDEWYPDEASKKEHYERGREALRAFHAKVLEEKPQPLHIEKGFTLKIGSVCVKGRIDRMDACDDGVEIIDYKTGTPKTEDDLKKSWEDRRQLVLYAMAVEQCFDPPVKVKKLTYYYLEGGTSVSFFPAEKDKDKLTNDVLEFMEKIQSSDFSATPGFHCQWCDFKDICEDAQI